MEVCKIPFVMEVGKFTSENWMLYMNVMWSVSLLQGVRENSEEFSWGSKLKQLHYLESYQ
jgi:hypothetical protein